VSSTQSILDRALRGTLPDRQAAGKLAGFDDVRELMRVAKQIRDQGHPGSLTWSPKVFIPLTELCRDVCHYCTFAKTPGKLAQPYLKPGQVLEIARRGAAAGCQEALFTLGEKPELRYSAARAALQELGFSSTVAYLRAMAERVWKETGLLPHLNPGTLSREEIDSLRPVAVSMGIMLESASTRLCARGGPHYGSPDKHPGVRLATIARAGAERVPMTSGILIGIGETRHERVESLLALRELHEAYGHIQEIIVQNFRRKPGTAMADAEEPTARDLLWTVAVARILFGPDMSIQAPPNLAPEIRRDHPGRYQRLGRYIPGYSGPRQSRGALAGNRAARTGCSRERKNPGGAAADLPRVHQGHGNVGRPAAACRRPPPRGCRRAGATERLGARHGGTHPGRRTVAAPRNAAAPHLPAHGASAAGASGQGARHGSGRDAVQRPRA